jgi:hypothetical protein
MRLLKQVMPLAMVMLLLVVPDARAWNRSPATTFATLPPGAAHPEGITVDAAGNVYVTTFAVGTSGNGHMFVFSPSGRLLRQVTVAGSSVLLLDLAFHPVTGDLLVIDFGNAQVLRVPLRRELQRLHRAAARSGAERPHLRRGGERLHLRLLRRNHLGDGTERRHPGGVGDERTPGPGRRSALRGQRARLQPRRDGTLRQQYEH